jgi:hypothetical protein
MPGLMKAEGNGLYIECSFEDIYHEGLIPNPECLNMVGRLSSAEIADK